MLAAQGDPWGALAARDPENIERQSDLAITHNRIGDVLEKQGDTALALTAYAEELAVTEALAARDPANTEWQRDFLLCHNKVSRVLAAQGDETAALAAYARSHAIAEALAVREPENVERQIALAVSHARLSSIQRDQSAEARLGHVQAGHDILVSLRASGRLPPDRESLLEQFGKLLAFARGSRAKPRNSKARPLRTKGSPSRARPRQG